MKAQLLEHNEIINACEALIDYAGSHGTIVSGNTKYNRYKLLLKAYVNRYNLEDKSNPFFSVLDFFYYNNRSFSINQKEAQMMRRVLVAWKHELLSNSFERIFISHREKDKPQVDAFINLLHAIGIPRPKASQQKGIIFCSSHPAYYIKNGERNLEVIKKELNTDDHTFYILWYTDLYFKSQACLNEAGAIWALSKNYQEILSPSFDAKAMGGLLDKQPVWFVSTDKYRLNTFKTQLEEMFDLDPLDINAWEKERDEFIERINILTEQEKI